MKPVLPNRTRLLRTLAIVAGLGVLSGCTTVRGWFSNDDKKADEPAALVEFSPSVSISPLWSANVGKGEGRLDCARGRLWTVDVCMPRRVTGGVRALDLQTGRQLWQVPSDIRLSGGPGAGDGLVVVGGLDGEVLALDAADRRRELAGEGRERGHRCPGDRHGHGVRALERRPRHRAGCRQRRAPLVLEPGRSVPVGARQRSPCCWGRDIVFVGNDDGSLSALAPPMAVRCGSRRWARRKAAPSLTAWPMSTARPSWTARPSTRPVSSARRWRSTARPAGRCGPASRAVRAVSGWRRTALVVSSADGTVYALDKTRGSALWQQPALARRNLTAPGVHGDYAVVGDMDGYLHWLSLETGEFAARSPRGARGAARGSGGGRRHPAGAGHQWPGDGLPAGAITRTRLA